MSRSKHGASRGPNPLIYVILVLVVIALVMAAVLLLSRNASREQSEPVASLPMVEESMPVEEAPAENAPAEEIAEDVSAVAAVEEPIPGEAMEIHENSEGDVWVETPYCNLVYPFGMSDTLRVQSESVADGLTVTFYGGINDLTKALYAIHFGVESNIYVGTLTLEDGTEIAVWAEIFEIVPEASWKEEESNTLYAMQECINDTLEYLQSEAGFTAAGE